MVMPKSNLQAAFALGSGSELSAQHVFANRVSEVAAFDSSVINLTRTLTGSAVSPVDNFAAPRRNVLVYYGVGGVGKTTLSQELETRFVDDGGKGARATVRLDYSDPSSFDLESYILRLRSGAAKLAHSFPAFDLAFTLYWERAHPGEPLRQFVERDTILSRTARAIGLSQAISESVNAVFSAVGVPGLAGTVQKLGGALYTEVKDAITRHRVLSRCELLNSFIDADADNDTLSYLPYLLSWDIQRTKPNETSMAVFIDRYEALQRHANRESECLMQRGVFLMPNVLFIITGRNRLDWAGLSPSPGLDYIGPDRWPDITPDNRVHEPRQHLIGYMSDDDAEHYLRTVLTVRKDSAIPLAIRQRIIAGSNGLPLYLDLAVARYLDLLSRGRQPREDDFGLPLSAIVARTLRDLDQQERHLVRTAALLTSVDLEMLRATWPDIPDAVLARFSHRSFLDLEQEHGELYSLHATLRDTIREVDYELDDAWSPRERSEVARRLADHLGDRAHAALDRGDRSEALTAIARGAELAPYTGELDDLLVESSKRLLQRGAWLPLSQLDTASDDHVSRALMLWLEGESWRRMGHLREAIHKHDAALGEIESSSPLGRLVTLHRAHALRVSGSYTQALEAYRGLTGRADSVSAEALYWQSDYAYLSGRFIDALDSLSRVDERMAEHLPGEILRLRGHIYRVNGLFQEGEAAYREALRLAESQRSEAARGKALTDLVQVLSWSRPQQALSMWESAYRVNADIGNQIEGAKLEVARAVCLAQDNRLDEANTAAEQARATSESYGFKGGVLWSLVAKSLCTVSRHDADGLQEVADRLRTAGRQMDGNHFWLQVVAWWAPAEAGVRDMLTTEAGEAQWLGSASAAAGRWTSVIARNGDG